MKKYLIIIIATVIMGLIAALEYKLMSYIDKKFESSGEIDFNEGKKDDILIINIGIILLVDLHIWNVL